MEDFWKKRFSNQDKISQKDSNPDDSYLRDIEKRLQSKATEGIMGQKLDKYYSSEVFDFEEKNKIASNRIKSLVVIYASLFGVVLNTSLVYYPSIKFVRKVFKLKGFWNIHFAALPLIMNWNAISLGLVTGIYQAFQMKQDINDNLQKETFNFWKF